MEEKNIKDEDIGLLQLVVVFSVVIAIVLLFWGPRTLLYAYLGAWALAGVVWLCSQLVDRMGLSGKATNPNSVGQKRLSIGTFLRCIAGALVGAIIGRLAAPQVLELFDETPVWVAPAVIIGAIALCLAAFMLIPQYLRAKRP